MTTIDYVIVLFKIVKCMYLHFKSLKKCNSVDLKIKINKITSWRFKNDWSSKTPINICVKSN